MPALDPKLLGWIARAVVAASLVAFVGIAASQTNAANQAVASPSAQASSARVVSPSGAIAPAANATLAVDPNRTTFSLDNDLISAVKWLGGITVAVLAIFAGLTLSFFGIDVRAVRKTLLETQEDLRKKADEVRGHEKSLAELKERLEKLGAELIDVVEKAKAVAPGKPVDPVKNLPPKATDPVYGPLSEIWLADEKKQEALRRVMAQSQFEWSTVGTLAKKTQLPLAEVKELAGRDPLVQGAISRNNEVLFRLKEFNELPPNMMDAEAWESWKRSLFHVPAKKEQGLGMVKKPPP